MCYGPTAGSTESRTPSPTTREPVLVSGLGQEWSEEEQRSVPEHIRAKLPVPTLCFSDRCPGGRSRDDELRSRSPVIDEPERRPGVGRIHDRSFQRGV
jgi:hypothetical protein